MTQTPKIFTCSQNYLENYIKTLNIASYNIEVNGIKTITQFQQNFESNTIKLIVVWNLQLLQKQYLPSLFNLGNKYSQIFPNILIFFHTTVTLPYQYTPLEWMHFFESKLSQYQSFGEIASQNAKTDELPNKHTLIQALKQQNKTMLENYIDSLNAAEIEQCVKEILSMIYKGLLKINPNPVLFALWPVIHKMISSHTNGLINSLQLSTLTINQMEETGLLK